MILIKRRILIILSLILAFTTSAFSQGYKYKVQPADVLSISVHKQPDLNTKTRVSDEGYLSFPLLGKVYVKDLATQQVEEKLKGLLEKDYLVNAQVTVFIEEYHPKQVSVVGEVEKPGKYDMPYEKKLTVIEAVAMAGGFTRDADIAGAKIMRSEGEEKEAIALDLNQIISEADKEKNIALEAGDIIVIPKGFWQVSVIGEVEKPGKYDMPKERQLTLMEALALAGGFAKDADIANTKILRSKGKEKEVININIHDITIRGNKDRNIPLEAEDIIVIPKGFWQVSVIGEVEKPGKYDMPKERPLTLMQAIATAGGFTKDADTKNVKVLRPKTGEQQVIKINTQDITKNNRQEKDIVLEPEDIVNVPESFF